MTDKRVSADDTCQPDPSGTEDVGGDRETEHADDRPIVADGGVEISRCMDVLASKRRRYVLYYLRANEEAELEEVTEQVAAWETGSPSEELGEQEGQDVRISLYHTHLPKLKETGLIDYDYRHGSMSLQNLPRPIDQILDYCTEMESPEIRR